jgi:hypothetical protein
LLAAGPTITDADPQPVQLALGLGSGGVVAALDGSL